MARELFLSIVKVQQQGYYYYYFILVQIPDKKSVLEEDICKALEKYYCNNLKKTIFSSQECNALFSSANTRK